jgi:hypothetical protein
MKVLVTLLGRSGWSLFNSVWAMVRGHDFVPDRIYILSEGCQMPLAEQVRTMLSVLLDEYEERHEIELVPLRTEMIDEVAAKVRDIADKEKRSGNTMALDVTSGTKSMVMGAVLPALDRNLFAHLFYLHIGSPRNADRPYITIPLSAQHQHDLLREVR